MKSLNLNDGGILKYEDQGTGRPIVLLHGWGMQGAYFKDQIAALSPRFRLLAPDLRGHGQSSHLEAGQGLSTLADDVAELIARLDLSQAMVIGWSMGAMVGWSLMRHAEAARISALVSIDMVPKLLNDPSWSFGLRKGRDASVFSSVAERMIADWPRFTRIFVPRIFARGRDSDHKALVDCVIRETEKNHPQSMAQLWMSICNKDFRNDLANLQLPTLVTYGALSQLYRPQASEWLANHIPNATEIGFANSGHAPHMEEPDLFNKAIEAFAIRTEITSSNDSNISKSEGN